MHKGTKTALFPPECMYTNAFFSFICNYRSLFFIQMSVCTIHQNTEFTEFLFLHLVSFRGARDWVHSSAPTRTSRLRAAYTESYLDFPSRNASRNPVKFACQSLRDVRLFQGWMRTFSFDFGEHLRFLGRSSLSWLLVSYSICCGYSHL